MPTHETPAATEAKIAGDTRSLLLSSVWSRLLGAVVGLLSARVLGPSDFGVLRIVSFVPSLAKFGSFGFDGVAEREIAHQRGEGQGPDRERAVKDTAFTADLLWAALLSLAVSGVALFTSRPDVRHCLWIAAGSLWVGQLFRLYNVVSALDKRFGLMAMATAIVATVEALVVVTSIYWGRMYSVLGGALLGSWAGVAWYRRSIRLGFSFKIERRELRRQFRIALPLAGGTLAFGAFAWIERLEVLALFGDTLLGIYMLSVIVFEIGLMLNQAILRATSIHLFEQLGAEDDSAAAADLVLNPSLILSYSFPLLGGLIWLWGPVVISTLLPQYLDVVSLLPWVGLMLTLRGVAVMPMIAMNSARLDMQTRFMLLWAGATAFFAATVVLVSERDLGIEGVAAAKCLTFLAMAAAAYTLTYRFFFRSRLRLLSFLAKASAPLFASAGLLWGLALLLPESGPTPALIKSLIFLVSYLPFLAYLEKETRFFALIMARVSKASSGAS